eukprot:213838-Chlamydomonas_euryale.AAC.3
MPHETYVYDEVTYRLVAALPDNCTTQCWRRHAGRHPPLAVTHSSLRFLLTACTSSCESRWQQGRPAAAAAAAAATARRDDGGWRSACLSGARRVACGTMEPSLPDGEQAKLPGEPLPDGPLLNGRYQRVNLLGQGAFGSVELVRDVKTNKFAALKR